MHKPLYQRAVTEPACRNIKGHETKKGKHQNKVKQNSEENNKEEPNLCRACWDTAGTKQPQGRAVETLVPLRRDPHTVRELCDNQMVGQTRQANLPHGFKDAHQNHNRTIFQHTSVMSALQERIKKVASGTF